MTTIDPALVERKTCDQCAYWHKGYTLHRSRMPATCNYPGQFHSAAGCTLACRDFKPKEDEQ